MSKVLVCLPTYKNEVHSGILGPLLHLTRDHTFDLMNTDSSACCLTFNEGWIAGLEARERGEVDYWLLWHSDIVPEEYFLDKMIALMNETGADVLSAIVPIKNEQGMTSTAFDVPVGDCDPKYRVKRLTMREAFQREATFTTDDLLLNTGLMLVDMRKGKDWVNDAFFTFEDAIIRYRGKRQAVLVPEDWGFSRLARKLGAKLWATREVQVSHMGLTVFPNFTPWGTLEHDTQPEPLDVDIEIAVAAADKVSGYMKPQELRLLARAAKGREVLEVGSWLGRSTKAMAMVAKRLYCVDHWRGSGNGDETGIEASKRGFGAIYEEFAENLGPEIAAAKAVPIQMDHADLDKPLVYSESMTMNKIEVPQVEFVFLDGDHGYEAVKRDITNCLRFVAPGGILAGHDYRQANPGVIRAVNELLPEARIHTGTSIWLHKVAEAPTKLHLVENKTVTSSNLQILR